MVSSLPPHKGISAYTVPLVSALADQDDVDLQVITFKSIYPRFLYPGGALEDRAMRADLPAKVAVRRMLDWYNPASWVMAARAASGDLVHAQWWSYPLAPVYATLLRTARARGKKVVMTVHNAAPHEGSRMNNLLNSAVYGLADHVIVHSLQVKEALAREKDLRGKDISVIPHGLIRPPGPESPDLEAARAELGIEDSASVVLYFGNIRPYKGLETLLEAFGDVVERVPEARLLIAGEPWTDWEPYRDQINGLGLRDKVIERLGFVPYDRVHLYFAAADVVALPYTHFDAQSGVAAMTLAFEKPAVVTDVGALPEIVSDRRAVVPPSAPKALADALAEVLIDGELRAKLACDAAETAKHFGWHEIAARTVEVYRSVLGTGG